MGVKALLVQYRLVTDRQTERRTDGQTHTTTAYTARRAVKSYWSTVKRLMYVEILFAVFAADPFVPGLFVRLLFFEAVYVTQRFVKFFSGERTSNR